MNESQANRSKPVTIRCRMNFSDEETFILKYAANISKSGIFAKTKQPREVGEVIQFEFSLLDGTELLRGLGRVAWTRVESKSGLPSGMGIKFLKLNKNSKALLERVIEFKEGRRVEKATTRDSHPDLGTSSIRQRDEHFMGSNQIGAEPDMNEHSRKTFSKIDLDAIDSMLDQIAAEPSKKKKRVQKKKVSLPPASPSPAPVSGARDVVPAPPTPEYVPSEVAAVDALEPEPPETTADLLTAVGAEAESAGGTAAESMESSAASPFEDTMTSALPSFEAEMQASVDFEAQEVESAAAEADSESIRAAAIVNEPSSDALELDAADILEEEGGLEPEPGYMKSSEESQSADEPDDAVLDLGPENETSQDAEPAKDVSVESVMPPPPERSSTISAVPEAARSVSSSPPPARGAQSEPPRTDPRAPIYGNYPKVDPRAPIYGAFVPQSAENEVVEYEPEVDQAADAFRTINPRAPIYSSAPPPAPKSSVPPQPIYPSEMPSVLPQGAASPTVPAAVKALYPSTVPPAGSVYPSSSPPITAKGAGFLPSMSPAAISTTPPAVITSQPQRASQVPVPTLTVDELHGILGEPGDEDAEARTAMIKEDELDALLNALEEGESPVELEDIEEISDIDDLEVIEVD